MSLRRKSCNTCFKGRRKCDLGYPACDACRRTKKTCRYAYAPMLPVHRGGDSTCVDAVNRVSPALNSNDPLLSMNIFDDVAPPSLFLDGLDGFSFNEYGQLPECPPQAGSGHSTTNRRQSSVPLPGSPSTLSSVPSLLGSLGEVQPVEGSSQTWQWVIDQIKSYPRDFAQHAQNIFIHKQLYRDSIPQPIRAAFGVSSSHCLINDDNRQMLFKVVDAEVLELLKPSCGGALGDELARLQALLLYQIVRLLHGDVEQRATAEQQQALLFTRAVKLVTRSQAELRDGEAVDWHTWILAECIRRTALVVYMLYGVYSIFREGICVGFPTLAKLPMSTATRSWYSEAGHQKNLEDGATMPYERFSTLWQVSTPRKLDPFEKFLLVACQGIDTITAFSDAEKLAA